MGDDVKLSIVKVLEYNNDQVNDKLDSMKELIQMQINNSDKRITKLEEKCASMQQNKSKLTPLQKNIINYVIAVILAFCVSYFNVSPINRDDATNPIELMGKK